jgi:hypothetical protein
MRDVNKVDALFVEEIPIIFPSETSLEITPSDYTPRSDPISIDYCVSPGPDQVHTP